MVATGKPSKKATTKSPTKSSAKSSSKVTTRITTKMKANSNIVALKAAGKKRKSVRFPADPGTIGLIDLTGTTESSAFRPTITSLVIEESYRGCGIVMAVSRELQAGDRCSIRTGHGPVLAAEVRWRTELDSQVMRLGIMYIENTSSQED